MDIEGTYLNIVKAIYDKPTTNIILSGEKLKTFPLRSGTREECPLSPLLINIVFKVLAMRIREKNKKNPDWKRRSKTLTVCRWQDAIHRKSKRNYQNITRANQWIHQSHKIHGQYTEITTFLYTNNEESKREIKESIPFTITTKRIKYLGINLPICRVHHEKCWAGRSTGWNQDCQEKYQ